MKHCFIIVLVMSFCSGNAFARAFYSAFYSSNQMALSGAGMTMGGNADVVASNPAAMARLSPGYHMSAGLMLVDAKYTWEGQDPTTDQFAMENSITPTFFVPTLQFALKPSSGDFSYGFTLRYPFNNQVAWDRHWEGSQIGYQAFMKTITMNPNVAYAISENHSVSFGINYTMIGFGTKASLAELISTEDVGKVDMMAEGEAFNYNFAYLGSFDKIFLAAQYTSMIPARLKTGQMDFNTSSSTYAGYSTDVHASFDLPWYTEMSIGWKNKTVDPEVELEFGVYVMGWSVYNKIRVTMDDYLPLFNLRSPSYSDKHYTFPTKYYDSTNYRAGMRLRPVKNVALMFGIERDQDVVPEKYREPNMPTSGLYNFAFGTEVDLSTDSSIGFHHNMSLIDRASTGDSEFTVLTPEAPTKGEAFNGSYYGNVRLMSLTYNTRF